MGLLTKFQNKFATHSVGEGARQEAEEVKLDEACGLEVGCGPCTTRRRLSALQCCATAKFALFFIGMGAVMQGFIINGHTNVIISTLEKRFELSSTESGLISSCYDIAACLSILVVTYVGTRGHKPLWLGWGILLMGVGGVVFGLPHFFAPEYVYTDEANTCGNPETESCTISSLKNFRFVFYFAMLVVGVGATPLYSLGVTYLDENVKQRYSAIYNGSLIACSILGPGIGYLVGAALLRIYVYPEQDATVTITSGSEQWVGAWWIGAMVSGVFTLLVALPVLMFPRQLPGTERHRKDREKDMHHSVVQSTEFGKRIRDFPKCLLILFRNPTFVFTGLGGAIDSLIISGLATFGPKYIENIFGLESSDAGTYFGLMAIIGGAGGQVVGGAILSRFKVSMRSMLHLCYIAPAICIFLSGAFLISCTDTPFAGVNQAYNDSTMVNLTSQCNGGCSCSPDVFSPVCGSDQVVYYSSCFAGCQNRVGNAFSNCSCIPGRGEATIGSCTDTGCGSGGMFILFCVLVFFFMFFTFANEASSLQISLRCVAFDQRSFGVGVQWLLIRLFGTIPGPLIVGALIDQACSNWSVQCGTRGSCLSYDSQKLSLYFFIFVCATKFVDTLIFFAGMLTYKVKQEDAETSSNRPLNSVCVSSKRKSDSGQTNGHVIYHQPERHQSALPGEIPSPRTQEAGFFENEAFSEGD